MTAATVAAWLFGVAIAQPAPRDGEAPGERELRLASIADDIAAVVEEPRVAMLVLATAWHESGFWRSVDTGKLRGSNGRDACLMQIHFEHASSHTAEGWTADDLIADRRKCIAVGLRILRASLAACGALPRPLWMSAYASGRCDRGHRESREIMAIDTRWLARWPVPREGT